MAIGLYVPVDHGSPFSFVKSGAGISDALGMPFMKSGVVKNSSLSNIFDDRCRENCATCFRMYRRNASLLHLPMIMIVSVGTFARNSVIAAPEQALKPSLASLILVAAPQNFFGKLLVIIILK